MSLEIDDYILLSTELYPKHKACGTEGKLIDFISIREKPWTQPIWHCKNCNAVFSGRSKLMKEKALKHARASARITDKINYMTAEEFENTLSEKAASHIKRGDAALSALSESVDDFRLK